MYCICGRNPKIFLDRAPFSKIRNENKLSESIELLII